MSKNITATPESQKLTVAERRAFIWASPRIHSKGVRGPYYLCSRTQTEAEPIRDADITVEKRGVKAAFDYLYGHANITRAMYGYWAVGHQANNTRKIFDDMFEAAYYAEVLRVICFNEAARADLHSSESAKRQESIQGI
jgi:hypothetical protein